MKHRDDGRESIAVLENGQALQTAVMRLGPGEESGPLRNEHAGSEQALLVVSGVLEADVGGQKFEMRAGASTIVPKNAPHRFVNRASESAVTFSVYAPPAY